MGITSCFFDSAFWKDFVSNFLATLLGLGLGVPIALWIDRITRAKQQRAENKARVDEAQSRKIEVLRLISAELNFNLVALHAILEHWPDDPSSGETLAEAFILHGRMKNETWRAFSDGGELGWINDPALLDFISHAYFQISRAMGLWDRLFEIKYLGGSQTTTYTIKSVEEALIESVRNMKRSIELAADQIAKEI